MLSTAKVDSRKIAEEILTKTGAGINFLVFGGGAPRASSQIQGSDPMVAHAAPPPITKKLMHAPVVVKISIAILLISVYPGGLPN